MYWFEEVLASVVGIVCVAAVLSLVFRLVGIYVGFSMIAGGILQLYLILAKVDRAVAMMTLAAFVIYCGITYLLLLAMIAWRRSVIERKRQRAEITRQLQYTLPQRENTYVQSRLQTSLCISSEKTICQTVPLGYVRELLSKVQASALSVGERLQVEEIGKVLTLYKGKKDWTPSELASLNDLCAFLLKLSAKYGV